LKEAKFSSEKRKDYGGLVWYFEKAVECEENEM
jgi:hypothetical protein